MTVSRLTVAKCLELLITIGCLILHFKSMDESEQHTKLIVAGTYVGFTIILIGVFAGYLLSSPFDKRIDIFYSLVGSALFMASGILVIQEWNNAFRSEARKLALSKGSLSIINAVVFLLDAVFTFREK